MQAWQDEQVTVFDCQERLRGYSFVSVVDLDEFLLPLRDDNLKDMMVCVPFDLVNHNTCNMFAKY